MDQSFVDALQNCRSYYSASESAQKGLADNFRKNWLVLESMFARVSYDFDCHIVEPKQIPADDVRFYAQALGIVHLMPDRLKTWHEAAESQMAGALADVAPTIERASWLWLAAEIETQRAPNASVADLFAAAAENETVREEILTETKRLNGYKEAPTRMLLMAAGLWKMTQFYTGADASAKKLEYAGLVMAAHEQRNEPLRVKEWARVIDRLRTQVAAPTSLEI